MGRDGQRELPRVLDSDVSWIRPASSGRAEILYDGGIVFQTHYVYVDGAGCILPLPQRIVEGDEVVGHKVSTWEVHFIQMLDEMSGRPSEFARYLDQAGFEVVEKHPLSDG